MSLHIGAEKGQIAKTVLMPGDPLRAQFIAENFLENAVRYSEIRNMYGYTGTYKGVPISVQGSGMGMPSMGIYSWELFTEYDVENIIRSCPSVIFLFPSLPPPTPIISTHFTCRASTPQAPALNF